MDSRNCQTMGDSQRSWGIPVALVLHKILAEGGPDQNRIAASIAAFPCFFGSKDYQLFVSRSHVFFELSSKSSILYWICCSNLSS